MMPEPYLTKWQLERDGDVVGTPRGQLFPVRLADGTAAMIKVSTHAEERNGHLLLDCWDGHEAARVLAHGAVLAPRLEQCRSSAQQADLRRPCAHHTALFTHRRRWSACDRRSRASGSGDRRPVSC